MTVGEAIKGVVIPLVTALTAVMVGVLNHQIGKNDQALRVRDQELRASVAAVERDIKVRDQQLKEKLAELDLVLKRSQEERAERESGREFNLKIYEILTSSIEERNPQKQEAAKAFIIVMVDEPLRSSLLNVLKQGGATEVKETIGQILEAEERFKSNLAVVPTKQAAVSASHAWGEWDFDIFWCASSGAPAKAQAVSIAERLDAEGAKGRIRVRELPESINARTGYQIDGYAIRMNGNEGETATALKDLAEKALANAGAPGTFVLGVSNQSTPWYISAFLCPPP